jgi:hypothetical protein
MATVTAGYNWVSGETVTPAKLNSAAAPTVAVADGEVTDAKLAATLDLSSKTVTLPDSNIVAAKIADAAVTTAKINNAAVTAAKLDGAQTGSAPIFGCRAWVNFDGTKDTTDAASTANTNRLIRGSGNVASVLRNGVGDYTVTFTTAMPDANYAVTAAASSGANNLASVSPPFALQSTSQIRMLVSYANTLIYDVANVHVAIFR